MSEFASLNPERRRILVGGVVLVLLVILLILAFIPKAIPVDIAVIERGEMMVTVKEEGKTRVKDVYTVSAPISGRVLRIESKVGDKVLAYKSVLANIEPRAPNFLDIRTRAQAESALKAAEAAQALAAADVARVEAELDYARSTMKRAEALAQKGNISQSALDQALLELRTTEATLNTVQAALRVKEYEFERARASLIDPGQNEGIDAPQTESCCIPIYAPVNGRVLRLIDASERVVTAGQPLIELGNPQELEIVVDLLSPDAVKVAEGSVAFIQKWGGKTRLNGEVTRVEPFGFTKTSALGIEEQRVNVVIDLTDPAEQWQALGHGYRVEIEIVTWSHDDVLKVPLGALFRKGESWATFIEKDGRASKVIIEVGHINSYEAEVISGLSEGDHVILHPSDRIVDDVRVETRPAL